MSAPIQTRGKKYFKMEHYVGVHAQLQAQHDHRLNQDYNCAASSIRRSGVKRKATSRSHTYMFDSPYEAYCSYPSGPPPGRMVQPIYYPELEMSYSHVMPVPPLKRASTIIKKPYAIRSTDSKVANEKQTMNDFVSGKDLIDTVKPIRGNRSSRKRKYNVDDSPDADNFADSNQSQRDPRALANDRERQRTQSLNEAFSALRKRIPRFPSDKLSKIQTLRMGRHYMEFLSTLCNSPELFPPSVMNNKLGDNDIHSLFSLWRIEHDLRDGRTDGTLS